MGSKWDQYMKDESKEQQTGRPSTASSATQSAGGSKWDQYMQDTTPTTAVEPVAPAKKTKSFKRRTEAIGAERDKRVQIAARELGHKLSEATQGTDAYAKLSDEWTDERIMNAIHNNEQIPEGVMDMWMDRTIGITPEKRARINNRKADQYAAYTEGLQAEKNAYSASRVGSEEWYALRQKNVDELRDQYEATMKELRAAEAQAQSGIFAGEFAYMYEDERKAGEAKVDELSAKAQELAQALSEAETMRNYAGTFRWEDVLNDPEFEGKAAAGLADVDQRRDAAQAAQALDVSNNAWTLALQDEMVTDELPRSGWTEEQQKIYGYLRERDKQNGTDEASEYGRSINAALNDKARQAQIEDVTDDSGLAMAGRSVVARGANLLSGADYLANVLEMTAKGYVMPKNYMSVTDYGRAVDSEITQRLNNASGTIDDSVAVLGGKGVGDIYGVLTSAIDSGLAIAVGGEAGSLALMATRSASNAYLDAKERGATDGQALNYGLASGAAEAIFEKFSVENLLSKDVSKSFLKRFFKQGAIEMSEEMATSFANAISESVLLAEKGELNDSILKNMANGMSYEEAQKRAMIDTAQSILYDGLAGFASGGLMVGGQTLAAGGNKNFGRQLDAYKVQEETQQAMRDAGVGSVENQMAGAMDVLEGRVTPEQQQEREAAALEKLGYSTREQAQAAYDNPEQAEEQRKAENRRETVRNIVERVATQQSAEMTDAERATLGDIYEVKQNGTDGIGYAKAAVEAFQMGKSGAYTAEEARAASENGAKLTAEQFSRAYNLGAGTEAAHVGPVDASTENGKNALMASLASLKGHAESAAEVYEDGQDVSTFAAAMNLATGYAANGGTVAELVQSAKADEGSGSVVAMLTEAQQAKAQEIGAKMAEERAKAVQERAKQRVALNQQAEEILEQENPDIGDINRAIKDLSGYITQARSEMETVRAQMKAMTDADPEAKSSEAYQQAEETADGLERDLSNYEDIMTQYRDQRMELKSKARRKKGTVSFDGATFDGKKYAGVDKTKLNKVQQRVVSMVEALADIINIDYVFFDGPAGLGGAYPGAGVIYININSGMGVRGFAKSIAAASLSHEFTHFAQEYAEEEYEELRKYIVDTIMKKSPAQFDSMVRRQMRWEPGKSYSEVVDEIVANGCMTMLQNTEAVKQVVRDHLTLAERFASRLEEIGQQIKDAFAEVDVNDNAAIYHVARELQDAHAEIQQRWDKAIAAATRNYNAEKYVEMKTGKVISRERATQNMAMAIPIDPSIQTMVSTALNGGRVAMTEIATISSVENAAINKFSGRTDEWRGKFTGGKHLISGQAISHSKGEHGNALREALRGQLPLTEDDIVLTLSAIKNGQARVTAPGRTNQGRPSIIQTVPVNGYTLYTEEINKKSWSDVSDLISHSMWKAPTLSTAAASGTSPVALPKRQSQVLSSYSITQNGKTSTVNFVADKNGNAVPLYYEEINGRPYRDTQNGGLAFLSADRSVANASLTRGGITQAYAIMRKPFIIYPGHTVFTNSSTDVAKELQKLRQQGYDGFIFDYHENDRYAVMVFNDAQIISPSDFAGYTQLQTWDEGEVYNDRAVISEETLDKWLDDYAASNPKYAQAYIIYMDPYDYLRMTTSGLASREQIRKQAEGLQVGKAVEYSKRQPIQLIIDSETGKVEGHEGRHRMVALQRAGIYKVPVLLFDYSNKYSKEPMKSLQLTGQDFNERTNTATVTVSDVQPLSRGNRDTVAEKFSKKGVKEKVYERSGYKTAQFQTWEDVPTDQQTLVNRTMTMAEAKRILDMTFNANNMRSYRGYKNAEEWLRAEGPSEVAMYAENTENVINQFMNRIPELIDYDVTFEEVFEAYMNGTLTGKAARAAKRMDTSKSTGYEDSRFYAPQSVTVTQQDLETAMLRANGNSKEQVFAARKKILFAAHTADGLQSIGMQAKDLNKLLRQWSRYPSRARDLSIELNRGVANENQWTGLQNSSILSLASVTDDDIRSMVKEIRGNSSEYQRNYIGRTMLALDTHINWSHLVFDFVNTGNASETALAYYEDAKREIFVGKRGSLNTVAHEMGHALDHLWERELFGGKSSQPLSENTFDVSEITSEEGRQFYHNFTVFMENLLKSSDITSNYEQRGTETFARFVARFTEWTEIQAGISSNFEQLHYKDRFTVAQYKEFVKLLQEKATIDAKRATSGQTQFQLWDNDTDDTAAERAGRDMAYARLQSENAILSETVEAMKKLTSKQGKTIEALQKKMQLTKTPEVRQSDARKLAKQLIQDNGSTADVASITEQIKEMGDYILQTETSKISEEALKNRARGIAREILETATDDFGAGDETFSRIAADIRGKKLSIDEGSLGELDSVGGYDKFRKSVFGRLTLAKREANTREGREGYTTVDQFYNSMQAEYGTNLFPDVGNEGEQVQILAQMLDASAPIQVNPYEQYMGEITEEFANKIVMDAMSGVLRPTAPTMADKQKARTKALQERIKELRDEQKMDQREAASLYATIYDLSVALDKAESRYQTLSKGAEKRIAQVQSEGRLRAAEIKATERAKAAENIKALREHYQDMAKKARQGRQNTASKNKIRKLINELNAKLEKPSENRYIPKELVQLTIDTLELIDLDTGRSARVAEKLSDIRAMYERYKTDPKYAVVYDEVTASMLSNLEAEIRGTKLSDMNAQQLDAVYQTLKSLNHVISKAVNVKIGEEEHNAYDMAEEMTHETREVPKSQKGWIRGHGIPAHLRADVAFDRFGGFKKNSTWQQVARMLNDGQLKQTRLKMELSLPFAKLFNNQKALADYTGMNKLGNLDEKKMVDVGLKDEDGNAILITRDFMVSLYMDLLNEDNRRHFIRGGKRVPNFKDFYNGKGGYGIGSRRAAGISKELSNLYSERNEAKAGTYGDWSEDVQTRIDELEAEGERNANEIQRKIEQIMTDYDREWVKAIQQLMDVDSKRELNQTTMDVYGIEKARVDNYFPLFTDKDFVQSPMETITKDASLENVGFMKERVQSGNPTRAVGSVWAVTRQIDRVAQYCGLMPAIRNFNKIYSMTQSGYQDSVKNALDETFGESGVDYIENLIADLTGSRKGTHDELRLDKLLAGLRGNLARSSLTLNPRVALAQAASFPTAAAELGYKPIMKALARGGKDGRVISRADQELIAKWSPLLWYRMQGYATPELGDIRNSNRFGDRVWRKLRFLTGWIQAVDGATVGRLWYAAEYWVQDHMPDLEKGSDAYYEAVAEKFNAVVEKTQPNYTTMQRAAILRSPNALVKTFTMFMTQRLQNFNILYDAAGRYQKARADFANNRNGVTKADVEEARNTMIRSVCSQIAQAAVYVGFKLLADGILHNMKKYRDDETGDLTAESISAQLLDNYIDALAGSVLFGSELYGIVKAAIGKEKWYGLSVSGVDSVNDLVDDIVALAQTEDPKKRSAKLLNVSKSLAQTLGIPLNNAIKIGQAIRYHIEDAANGNPWQEAGYERTKAQNTEKLIRALDTGNEADILAGTEALGGEKDALAAVKAYLKKQYAADETDDGRVISMLTELGMDEPDAQKTVEDWAFDLAHKEEYEEAGLTMAQAKKYYDIVEPSGIKINDYAQIIETADENGNGSLTQDELGAALSDEIAIGNVTKEQADAIWSAQGWSADHNLDWWMAKH